MDQDEDKSTVSVQRTKRTRQSSIQIDTNFANKHLFYAADNKAISNQFNVVSSKNTRRPETTFRISDVFQDSIDKPRSKFVIPNNYGIMANRSQTRMHTHGDD